MIRAGACLFSPPLLYSDWYSIFPQVPYTKATAIARVKEESQNLKSRLKETHRRLQKAKFWDNPEKQKQLEKLLAQMESLLADQ